MSWPGKLALSGVAVTAVIAVLNMTGCVHARLPSDDSGGLSFGTMPRLAMTQVPGSRRFVVCNRLTVTCASASPKTPAGSPDREQTPVPMPSDGSTHDLDRVIPPIQAIPLQSAISAKIFTSVYRVQFDAEGEIAPGDVIGLEQFAAPYRHYYAWVTLTGQRQISQRQDHLTRILTQAGIDVSRIRFQHRKTLSEQAELTGHGEIMLAGGRACASSSSAR